MKCVPIRLWIFAVVHVIFGVATDGFNGRPPSFYDEPESQIVFSNSSGKVIPCSADGYPQPTVMWVNRDGVTVRDVPGLRHIRRDGSLSFPPFSGDNYRNDVHASSYRCIASNAIGTISSRVVRVKTVVPQRYDIKLSDGFVLRGNMAILECPFPSYTRDYVRVTAWERTDGFIITPDTSSGKFGMLHNGDLYILDVSERDNPDSFRCHTENVITKAKKTSINYSRVIVTAPHHPQPPRVIRTSSTVVVPSGSRATLSCVAQGHPSPSYRWLRKKGNLLRAPDFDGSVVREGGILIFRKVMPSDAGHYVCLVSNAVGEDRTEARLDVTEPLRVTLSPKEVQADAGQAVSFNCTVYGGNNEAQVSWMKDGRPLTTYAPGSRVILYPPSYPTILRLKSVGRQDAGIYQCFADTASDSAQASAILVAGDLAPKLLYTFSEKTVHPGNFVSLFCHTSGSPVPQIKWTVDGLWPITTRPGLLVSSHVLDSGDVLSYVNISSVDVSDGGLYTCLAENEEGVDLHSARLNVYGPVMVRRLARNLTALSGEIFTIQCPYGGYPFDGVRWIRGGNVLPLMQRQKVFSNGTLAIYNVQRGQDDGPYTCEVSTRQGSHASGTFWISVKTGPKVTPFSFDEDLHEGMRTAVPCIVPSGDKPFTIRWLKDGQPILDGYLDATIIYPEGGFVSTLTIESLAREHNGNYTCSASNEFATSSHSSVLTVKVPPKWVLKPGDLSAITGNQAKIDCQADGVPQPHIRWKKATGQTPEPFKTMVSSSRVHSLVNGSLNFKEVSPDDAGSYLCEADNGVGAALTTVVKLIVHSAPQFRTKFSVLTARRGQRMVIECVITRGEQPITFIWSKNGVVLDMEDETRYSQAIEDSDEEIKSQFVIGKAERQDSALFTCTATNNYGEDSTNIQLTVQDIPDAPQNLDVHDISSRSVRLTWNKPFDGNSPITNYTVAWRQLDGRDVGGPLTIPGSETTLTVRGLIPSTRYFFRVKCRNNLGESQYSAEVAATTLQEPPRHAPVKVSASAVSSKIVNITWEYPTSTIEGSRVEGFYVGYKARNSPEPFSFIPVSVPDASSPLYVHRLYNLNRLSEYAVVVQAYNSRGAGPPSEEIYVRTLEFDPPSVPFVKNHRATTSTITLSWELVQSPDAPISGYIMYHRWEGSSWIETYLKGTKTEYVLHDLRCGTVYLCYLVAFNGAGRSNATDIVTVKTEGNPPVAPEKRMLLTVNSSSVSIRLPSWRDGGCAISSFALKYKKAGGRERWTLVTDDADPQQRDIIVAGLEPGTWYVLFMSARNDAGTTDAEYTFATLTLDGEYPPRPSEVSEVAGFSLYYRHLTITVPLVSFSLVVSLVFCAICFVNRTRRFPGRRPRNDEGSVAPSSTKPEQLPLSVTYEGHQESVYFPSPYATAHLQGEEQCRNQEVHRGSTKHMRSMGTFVGNTENGCTYDTPYPIGRGEKFEPVYEPPIVYFPAYHRGLRSCGEEVVYEIPDRGRNKISSTAWRDPSDGDSSTESDNENVFRSLSHSEILKEEARESETECDRLWKAYEGSQYESSKRLADGHVILS